VKTLEPYLLKARCLSPRDAFGIANDVAIICEAKNTIFFYTFLLFYMNKVIFQTNVHIIMMQDNLNA
jgi:hypothetical protein